MQWYRASRFLTLITKCGAHKALLSTNLFLPTSPLHSHSSKQKAPGLHPH
jgi:hypothetical protein